MSWQICGECRGCPASPWHKKKCRERNDEQHELEMIEHYTKEFERDDYY